jgi:hypothetical protein
VESLTVIPHILPAAARRRHCAAHCLCALLDGGPSALPTIPRSTVRCLARAGLIVRAGRDLTSGCSRVAWAIADRSAAIDLLARLARLDRSVTPTLYPE